MLIKTDIVVVGGGMAGFSAAYTLSKFGKKVLLIDKRTYLGGVATGGLVFPLMGISTDTRKVLAGNLDEIMSQLSYHFPESINHYHFDPEAMKHCLDIMATDSGVDILFDTVVKGVLTNDRQVMHIIAVNKSGEFKIEAKYFIDATGDADLSYMCDVPTAMGREIDGKTQAYTLRFILGNVDVRKARKSLKQLSESNELEVLFSEYSKEYDVPIMDNDLQNFVVPGRRDSLGFNVPRLLNINGIDGKSLSDGYLIGRKLIRVYVNLLRDNVEGFSEAVVTNTADTMGVRESRRIIGQYVLTKKDVIDGRKFSDGICGSCWWIDVHNPDGKGVSEAIMPKGGYYDVPYRSLITNEYDNLLVAGRCISADHEALASARIMPTCIATGQAAGTAASIAMSNKHTVNQIDIEKLRNKLVEHGALITDINLF